MKQADSLNPLLESFLPGTVPRANEQALKKFPMNGEMDRSAFVPESKVPGCSVCENTRALFGWADPKFWIKKSRMHGILNKVYL